MGESGSGKTTLLRILSGLQKPEAGTVSRTGEVAVCFQEYRLFPQLSAMDNVLLLAWRHPGEADRQKAASMLTALGLTDEEQRKKPSELSGGMKQRVSLARALCADVPIVLLDEPLKELDASLKRAALSLIREKAMHSLVIMTQHEPEAMQGNEAVILDITRWKQ